MKTRWRGRGLLFVINAALAAGIVAGCTSAPPRGGEPGSDVPAPRSSARAGVNLSGFPPAYREGYSAGCEGGRRDEARYKSDTSYMMGWDDGRSVCASRK